MFHLRLIFLDCFEALFFALALFCLGVRAAFLGLLEASGIPPEGCANTIDAANNPKNCCRMIIVFVFKINPV